MDVKDNGDREDAPDRASKKKRGGQVGSDSPSEATLGRRLLSGLDGHTKT